MLENGRYRRDDRCELVFTSHHFIYNTSLHHIIILIYLQKLLTDVIDVGVTHLIREPKKCLKFNFVVDKTLNGVINMTTHLGYKRLEKLGTQLDQDVASKYVDYFLNFMRHQA